MNAIFTNNGVISFDSLALEQLDPKRFMTQNKYDKFFQGEYSFYINAVEKTFSPSSRSPEKVSWENISVRDYFCNVIKNIKDNNL